MRYLHTFADPLVFFPGLGVEGATQRVKNGHKEAQVGFLLPVMKRVVPESNYRDHRHDHHRRPSEKNRT